MVDVIGMRWRAFFRPFLHAVWPSACVLCGAPAESLALDLCNACRSELPVNDPACSRCAQPLARPAVADLLCGACLRRPPRFDSACCALRYAYPVDHLVRALKFGRGVAQGRVLGELLALHVDRAPRPEVLIPIPLAPGRYRQRGYNQAIELGRVLERRLNVPLRCDLVVRTRETTEQAGLKRSQRRRNVRGAFALTGRLPARHVAIVDDVVTTASTVNELARILRKAGAERIDVWAAARAGNV